MCLCSVDVALYLYAVVCCCAWCVVLCGGVVCVGVFVVFILRIIVVVRYVLICSGV